MQDFIDACIAAVLLKLILLAQFMHYGLSDPDTLLARDLRSRALPKEIEFAEQKG